MLTGAADFLDEAADLIAAEPLSTNVMGVVALATKEGRRPAQSGDLWTTLVTTAPPWPARVVGAAMHTPPYNLFLSPMPRQATEALARKLYEEAREARGVTGERSRFNALGLGPRGLPVGPRAGCRGLATWSLGCRSRLRPGRRSPLGRPPARAKQPAGRSG